jgi:hypothetical protein
VCLFGGGGEGVKRGEEGVCVCLVVVVGRVWGGDLEQSLLCWGKAACVVVKAGGLERVRGRHRGLPAWRCEE